MAAAHMDARGLMPSHPQNAEVEAVRSEWLQYEAVLSSARDMRTMEGRVAQRAADRLTSLANELALGSRAAEMAVQVTWSPSLYQTKQAVNVRWPLQEGWSGDKVLLSASDTASWQHWRMATVEMAVQVTWSPFYMASVQQMQQADSVGKWQSEGQWAWAMSQC